MKLKWVILFLLCTASAHAQMYRWVDADGKITYSDNPPPPTAVKQQKKSISSDEQGSTGLTYALSESAKNFPVTLYTSSGCVPCDDGRKLLKSRGIPFSEKTVSTSEDAARLKQAGGDGRLPFFIVGRNTRTGFDADTWNTFLTSAGYPETSQLPANYKFPAPEPAAPPPPVVEKPQVQTPPANNAAPVPPAPGTIPGFRF